MVIFLIGKNLLKRIPQESHRFIAKLPEENTAQCIVVVNQLGDCQFLLGGMQIHEKISPSMVIYGRGQIFLTLNPQMRQVEAHEDLIKNAPLIVMDGNIGIGTMDKVLEMALKHNVPGEFASTKTPL